MVPYPSDMDGLKQNPRGEQIKEDGKKEKKKSDTPTRGRKKEREQEKDR